MQWSSVLPVASSKENPVSQYVFFKHTTFCYYVKKQETNNKYFFLDLRNFI